MGKWGEFAALTYLCDAKCDWVAVKLKFFAFLAKSAKAGNQILQLIDIKQWVSDYLPRRCFFAAPAFFAALFVMPPAIAAEIVDEQLAECVAAVMQQAKVNSASELVSLTCNGSDIKSAEGIGEFTSLETLSLFGNQIAQIDVSALTNLKTLNLANNRLEQIDVMNNQSLEVLYLFGNALKGLNLESNALLKKVKAEKNQILGVVFPESLILQKVYLFDNKMEDIKIDSLKGLRFLDVRSNPMPDEVYDYLDEFSGVKASHDGNTEEWR
ncbi:MAG: leucine-rich repeat domain-containing protein, partial [Halioglobus sp.]